MAKSMPVEVEDIEIKPTMEVYQNKVKAVSDYTLGQKVKFYVEGTVTRLFGGYGKDKKPCATIEITEIKEAQNGSRKDRGN